MDNFNLLTKYLEHQYKKYYLDNRELPLKDYELKRMEIIDEINNQLTPEDLKDMNKSQVLQLGQRIWDKFLYSRVDPNKFVGVIAGQALGEGQTQANLDAKRLTGTAESRRKADSFTLIKRLVEFNNTKNPSDIIYFKPELSYKDIFLTYYQIKETKMADIIENKEIMKTEKEEWRNVFKIIFNIKQTANMHYRISLNKKIIKERNIKIQDIIKKLQNVYPDFTYIYSDKLGFIEIHSNGTEKTEIEYINTYKLNLLNEIIIKGIEGIKNIYLENVNLLHGIENIKKNKKKIIVIYSREFMNKNMVYLTQIMDYFSYRFNVSVKQLSDTTFSVPVDFDVSYFRNEMNTFYIDREDAINRKEELKIDNLEELENEEIIPLVNLYQKSLMWYFDTDGSNIFEILKLNQVDRTRTYKDDINWILEYHGVEACRYYYIWKLKNLIQFDISDTNIKLLADVVLSRKLIRVNKMGHSEQNTGWLELSSFEQKMDMMLRAGFYGQKDDLNTAYSGVIAGKLINMGTNSITLHPEK
jgi:hypothetical protein